jgi:hypothetical protein
LEKTPATAADSFATASQISRFAHSQRTLAVDSADSSLEVQLNTYVLSDLDNGDRFIEEVIALNPTLAHP